MEEWRDIVLSAKVFGHISQGLYRTSAGAIKELVSNAFDADATLVRIHTDFPRFETFSCEDNGTGMSVSEFRRLMDQGIGNSSKRIESKGFTKIHQRPLIGRLGLGILSLAQICTQFDIVSHHKESRKAFRATIKFPAYTREEMDKILKDSKTDEVKGGQYQIVEDEYQASRQGVRVFTTHLREQFRKRMRSKQVTFSNTKTKALTKPYKRFDDFIAAVYDDKPIPSFNLLSDYEQLLFGLALIPPLPLIEKRNVALEFPFARRRQAQLKQYDFRVQVDNLELLNPVVLPSNREKHRALNCKVKNTETKQFVFKDGPFTGNARVIQHDISVDRADITFRLYELDYSGEVAGRDLSFSGYLFQQNGRLYPRDIQGVLIRLQNVAIGKYDNSMMTYPFGEGPRYSMISCEIFVERGFDDALNIDRDSFNELHPHYIRTQAYIHSLLHQLIFPESWGEEKSRNKKRREKIAREKEKTFLRDYEISAGENLTKINRVELTHTEEEKIVASPVQFKPRHKEVEIDISNPLLQPALRKRRHAALVERIAIAFERANNEKNVNDRRALFYSLLADIFREL